MRTSIAIIAVLTCCLDVPNARASTAAFQGTVTEVKPASPNHKDTLVKFTCSIDYFDYCSWSKFGKESKTGIPITRQVRKIGTAGMIDGRLENAAAFAKAIKPGQWGYFYEDTWLDLHTTPDFKWGEVVSHTPGKRAFTLRIHKTHKAIHSAANPPQNVDLLYGAETVFRNEAETSTATDALTRGNWVQVHPARGQIVNVWSSASGFDPGELLPADQGKRGYANDLTASAVLLSIETETPMQVIDLSCNLTVRQTAGGKSVETTIPCRSTSFVLDGKLCPAEIAVRKQRHAVLGHYRTQKSPHKVLVRSHDDTIRGVIKSVESMSVVVTSSAGDEVKVKIAANTQMRLDGVSTNPGEALKAGREITVYPQRGTTIVSFK